ncbi:MAG: hypothetical protein P4M14_13060 [Gammaproteobacteria bacterium]|nr:hypothetical protein [Gammaproteobacteria bacterium]
MISLQELRALAEEAYASMEGGRYTVFGLVERKTKANSLTTLAEENIIASIKSLPQQPAVAESEKLKSLVDILVICAEVEALDITPLEGHKALQKLITNRQTLAMNLLFGTFLAKYNELAMKAETFIDERSKEQLQHRKMVSASSSAASEQSIQATPSTNEPAINAKTFIDEESKAQLQRSSMASSASSSAAEEQSLRDIATIEAIQKQMDEKLATLQQKLEHSVSTKDSKIQQLEGDVQELTIAYEKSTDSYTKYKQENAELLQALATFEKSQEDSGFLAEKGAALLAEHEILKTEHSLLLEKFRALEQKADAYNTSLLKARDELKATKERLHAESTTREVQRIQNERVLAKIETLNIANGTLAKEKTALEQRVKVLELQVKKVGTPAHTPKLFQTYQQFQGGAHSTPASAAAYSSAFGKSNNK